MMFPFNKINLRSFKKKASSTNFLSKHKTVIWLLFSFLSNSKQSNSIFLEKKAAYQDRQQLKLQHFHSTYHFTHTLYRSSFSYFRFQVRYFFAQRKCAHAQKNKNRIFCAEYTMFLQSLIHCVFTQIVAKNE